MYHPTFKFDDKIQAGRADPAYLAPDIQRYIDNRFVHIALNAAPYAHGVLPLVMMHMEYFHM